MCIRDSYYLVALVFGSAVAAVWNYLANHNLTFASSPLGG